MKLIYASLTDQGVTRDHNEDHFINSQTFALNLVADGMGGYECGDIASKLALTSVIDYLKINTNQSGVFTERSLRNAIQYANSALSDFKKKNPEVKKMGTTLVCFAPGSSGGYAFNIGDSRLYRFHHGELKQITKDNSAEQEVLPDFMQNANDGKYSSVLTRALGTDKAVEADSYVFEFSEKDVLLLCSDGLYSMIEDKSITRILKQDTSLTEKCKALIDAANEAGGEDNITATLIYVDSKANPDQLEMTPEKNGAS
jgi:serine/threonine protein phosphatase PrpC